VLSAVAKLYAVPTLAINIFEVKYLGSMGITGAFAKLMSRFIIGLEFAIAIMILFPYYIKKIIFPLTIGVLAVFSAHLTLQVFGGVSTNCGCFGELIPMTPLQALIKNIVTILLLLVPLLVYKDSLKEEKSLSPVIIISLACWLAMFALVPQKSGSSKITTVNVDGEEVVLEIDPNDGATYFADAKKGFKILCFFSPTCDHCMATGKKLTELKQQYPDIMPEIRILFMDEADNGSPEEIKQFFEFIGAEYQYQVLSIEDFIPIFFAEYNFPGVKYLHNGEEVIFFEGTESNEFNADKLLEEIKKNH
jgi:thiol-disulfide isomerase/thioredoxin